MRTRRRPLRRRHPRPAGGDAAGTAEARRARRGPPVIETWRRLYRHRELAGVLVARSLKLRYRGSALGFAWTLLNPLLLMLVYVLVFSVYLRIDMDRYAAFLLSGLVPWIWFSSSVQQGATSILEGAPLVTRSQFPPEVLPVVALTANTVNFLLTLPLLLAVLVGAGVPLGRPLLALPVLVALQYVLCLGPVLLVAAATVYFRDLQHLLTHLLTVLLFLTPVFYPATLIPEPFRFWMLLNPLAVVVGAFQDALYFNRAPRWPALLGVLVLALALLWLAGAYFRRHRGAFAETL